MLNGNHYSKTRKFFDEKAIEKKGFYEIGMKPSFYQTKVRKIISKIFAQLTTRKNLDVGCGNGDFIIELAKKYRNLDFEGVDFSPEMIKVAKKRIKNIRNVKFNVDNILSLKFKDKQFDTIFCINTLHHIRENDQQVALKELARLSKNNIILDIKNKDCISVKLLHRENSNFKAYYTNIETVKNILSKYGFKLVKAEPLWYLPFLSMVIVLHFRAVK